MHLAVQGHRLVCREHAEADQQPLILCKRAVALDTLRAARTLTAWDHVASQSPCVEGQLCLALRPDHR